MNEQDKELQQEIGVNPAEEPEVKDENIANPETENLDREAIETVAEQEAEQEAKEEDSGDEEHLSLNDDRRVKVLSPGMLVLKRFFRNKVAVVGLIILAAMFVFSFIGALFSPYGEAQRFYRIEDIRQPIGGAKVITEVVYDSPSGTPKSSLTIPAGRAIKLINLVYEGLPTEKVVIDWETPAKEREITSLPYGPITQSGVSYTIQSNDTVEYTKGADTFTLTRKGGFYEVIKDSDLAFIGYTYSLNAIKQTDEMTFDFKVAAFGTYEDLKATSTDSATFNVGSDVFELNSDGEIKKGGEDYAYIMSYNVKPISDLDFYTQDFKEAVIYAIENNPMLPGNEKQFDYVKEGETEPTTYSLIYNAASEKWEIKEALPSQVYDKYSAPSGAHWLGTDGHGMDMLTRLMYGGRVSLLVGFIVVIIETVLGVIMGGIAGYFGGWVDNIIMRLVDVFYCIPTTPILIILGAAMDEMRVDPTVRLIYLMLLLGFFGWAGVARLVRGQILSLREQEFMTATEACGISAHRRIFRHLIPNVIPQLIVTCTMGLGSTILIEATLSFLGLGVRFPFASWGNIINDVNDVYVLTHYLFVWIPAGVCIVLTVLAFNLVGDGLRDAFDPRMKR